MQYNNDLTKYFDRYYELSLPELKNKDRKSMPRQIEKRSYVFKYNNISALKYNQNGEELLGIYCLPKNFSELSDFLNHGEYEYSNSLAFLERIRDVLIKYANYSYYKLDKKDYNEKIHTDVHDKTVEDYCFCFNGILLIPPVLVNNGDTFTVNVDTIEQNILYSYHEIFNNIKMTTNNITNRDVFHDRSKGLHNYIYPIKHSKAFKPVGLFGYMTFGFCHSDHPPLSNLPTRDRISFFVNDNGDVRFWHNHVKPLEALYD